MQKAGCTRGTRYCYQRRSPKTLRSPGFGIYLDIWISDSLYSRTMCFEVQYAPTAHELTSIAQNHLFLLLRMDYIYVNDGGF